jgi:hypothetical protein
MIFPTYMACELAVLPDSLGEIMSRDLQSRDCSIDPAGLLFQ